MKYAVLCVRGGLEIGFLGCLCADLLHRGKSLTIFV